MDSRPNRRNKAALSNFSVPAEWGRDLCCLLVVTNKFVCQSNVGLFCQCSVQTSRLD